VAQAVEPRAGGLLDVGDGQRLFWEESGNPDGRAVVALHGGPGSGSTAGLRHFFDPALYRIVLFDQRGCGRSVPHASDPAVPMDGNTTADLLEDIERLRVHLGIGRWVVFGLSWGTVLGLAYAERHPERVAGLVLAGVAVGRRAEIDWLYRGGLGRLFPEQWERFTAGLDGADRDPIAAYRERLDRGDADAARRWTEWDWSTASVEPTPLSGRWADPLFQLARARICAHYFQHDLWLEEGALIANAGQFAGIPGVLINGRLDLQCPLASAWELHRAWPGSELVVVGGAGHSTADPGMGEAILEATNRLR